MRPQQVLRESWISADSMPALAEAQGVEAAVGNQTGPGLPTDKDDEEGATLSRHAPRGGRLTA